MNDLFRIHPEDTVAVALRPIPAGETAQGNGFSVRAEESIPQGHKIALCRMEKGGEVIKNTAGQSAAQRKRSRRGIGCTRTTWNRSSKGWRITAMSRSGRT